MKPFQRNDRLWTVALAVGFLLGANGPLCAQTQAEGWRAQQGVLDLRDWDPEIDGPVELGGEWRFYWRQLLSPDSDCALSDAPVAELPGVWTGTTVEGEALGAEGYATYCLRVLLSERQSPLSLRVPRLRTSSALWVDGVLLGDTGQVGTDRASSRPRRVDSIAAITPKTELDLVLQISNFHFRTGGAHRPVILGTPVNFEPLADGRAAALAAFFIGAFIALGLYHLLTQPLRARRGAHSSFGALCLVMAGYQLTRENNLFVVLFPWVTWPYEIRLEYSFFGLCVVFAGLFIRATYPGEVPRAYPLACLAVSGVFIVGIWTLPLVQVSDWLLLLFQFAFLAIGIWGVARLALALVRRRPGSRWFLIGGSLWVLSAFLDGFLLRYFPGVPRLLPFGFMWLILAQTVLLAIAQTQSDQRTKNLSNSLLKLASEKLALETMAYRDPLTGLENRRRLDEGAAKIRQQGDERFAGASAVSLLYLDVDDFKAINDRHGHEVGDEVLIRIAGLLREEFRSYDLSARLGGDEFAVLLGAEESEARAQARRLQERLEQPLSVGDRDLHVAVSIGVATVDADEVDLGRLLRRADRDMYRDKSERKSGRRSSA
ncbi:MAG: diguanylate cyclase [Acidobacteriota bacterium]